MTLLATKLVPTSVMLLTLAWQVWAVAAGQPAATKTDSAIPEAHWASRTPEQLGLSREKLDALRELVGGRGCVVRHGYMAYAWGDQQKSTDVASAMKPVISTLMLIAVQDKKIADVNEPVSRFEPRLKALNGGKDAGISWRHLASQTSGYGLAERPGTAWSYNDFALALYYDTLMDKVYRQPGTSVLKLRLAEPLQFEDDVTFEAFGPDDRKGRLSISVRDFARFGLLWLHGGRWGKKQVLDEALAKMALSSPVPADLPRTSAQEAAMLPAQRTIGGTRNITPVGPGYYTFNWWSNGKDRQGRRLFVDAPPDTYVASGHGGPHMLWVVPSLDLIVSWNDSPIEDHDASPGNPRSKCNQAARLMRDAVLDSPRREAAQKTRVTIRDGKWQINERVTYPRAPAEGLLMNVRMVNAVFEDRRRPDFNAEANTDAFVAAVPDYVAHGMRAFTIGLQGGMPGYEAAMNSAFEADGSLRPTYMARVSRVIEACDRNGAAVILGCFYQRQDQVLADEAAVRAGVTNVVRWLRRNDYRNVMLEVANEFGHGGFDHDVLKSTDGQAALVRLAKREWPELLVSTSGMGDGRLPDSVAGAADFLLVHFNGVSVDKIPERVAALKRFAKPIVCNEDDKDGEGAAGSAAASVRSGASWGLMLEATNQHFPFRFDGARDDPVAYAMLKELTTPIH